MVPPWLGKRPSRGALGITVGCPVLDLRSSPDRATGEHDDRLGCAAFALSEREAGTAQASELRGLLRSDQLTRLDGCVHSLPFRAGPATQARRWRSCRA